MREFERRMEAWVEQEFESARIFPDHHAVVCETHDFYDPHAPRETLAGLKRRTVRALVARRRFNYGAAHLQVELPLTLGACERLANIGQDGEDRRTRQYRQV
jgi:hypothetical protein